MRRRPRASSCRGRRMARRGYLVPAKGEVEVNGVRLNARDGAAISGEDVITVTAVNDAEIVLVDAA